MDVSFAQPPALMTSFSAAVPDYYGLPTVYWSGCKTDFEGRNCSIACLQSHSAWTDMATFHNCLMYPLVSLEMSAGVLIERAAKDLAKLGYLSSYGQDVADTMSKCLYQFCVAMSGATESCGYASNLTAILQRLANDNYGYALNNSHYARTYEDGVIEFVTSMCYAGPNSPNVDIGGIGVFVSYILQVAIMLLFWVALQVNSLCERSPTFLPDREPSTLRPKSHARADGRAATIVTALVDFQKAQSFFAITLQGAALLAMSGSGRLLEAKTPQMLKQTISTLGNVAVAGIVTMTFGLHLLHLQERRSTFVSWVTSIGVAISTVTWVMTIVPLKHLKPSGSFTTETLDQCRGLRTEDLAAQCDFDVESQGFAGPALQIAMVVVCAMTIACHLYFQIKEIPGHFLARYSSLRQHGQVRSQAVSEVSRRLANMAAVLRHPAYGPWAHRILHASIQLAFLAMLGLVLAYLVTLDDYGELIYSTNWTFGQIIAVTIWAPTIVETIFSIFYGLEQSQEHRYMEPYKLIKHPDATASLQELLPVSGNTAYMPLSGHSEIQLPPSGHLSDMAGRLLTK